METNNFACFFWIDVPCYSEENRGSKFQDHSVEELPPCSVITSYSFTTHSLRPHKVYISSNDNSSLKEYMGDVKMKVSLHELKFECAVDRNEKNALKRLSKTILIRSVLFEKQPWNLT